VVSQAADLQFAYSLGEKSVAPSAKSRRGFASTDSWSEDGVVGASMTLSHLLKQALVDCNLLGAVDSKLREIDMQWIQQVIELAAYDCTRHS
jgi:hypothetical protein